MRGFVILQNEISNQQTLHHEKQRKWNLPLPSMESIMKLSINIQQQDKSFQMKYAVSVHEGLLTKEIEFLENFMLDRKGSL